MKILAIPLILFLNICIQAQDNTSSVEGLCEKNDFKACVDLGSSFKRQKKLDLAEKYFLKSCKVGNITEGCMRLAMLYTLLNKKKETNEIYEVECKKEVPYACFRQGLVKAASSNPEDKKEAIKLFEFSCSKNESSSCFNLGVMEENKNSITLAIFYYEKSCNEEMQLACFNLGLLRQKEGKAHIARALFEKACSGKLLKACINFAAYLKSDGDVLGAKAQYDKACSGNEPIACVNLALIEFEQKNLDGARQLFKKACSEKNLSKECIKLSSLLNTN